MCTLFDELKYIKPTLMHLLKLKMYSQVLNLLTSTCSPYNLPQRSSDRTAFTPYDLSCNTEFNLSEYVNCSKIIYKDKMYIAASKPKGNISAFLKLCTNVDIIVSCIMDINYLKINKSIPHVLNNKIIFYDEEGDDKDTGKKCRLIRFNNWIDHDVLDKEVFEYFFQYLDKLQIKKLLVHCEAGVGRTGVVIMYDILRKYENVDLDLFVDTLIYLRSCRNGMVYSCKQLEFLCKTFLKEF